MSQILISYNRRFLFNDSTIISALDIQGNVTQKVSNLAVNNSFDVRGRELTPSLDELFYGKV